MSTTHAHVLQKRHFRLDEREGLRASGVWFEGRPLATQLLNAYTLLIPAGERFIIRSCRRVMHKADAALTDELRALFFQEGTHAREHDRMRAAMTKQGVGLGPFRRFLEWISYDVLEPLTPPVLRLATAAAIEHHNAVIASYFIGQDLLRGIQPGETRRLLLWHFAEEIEHKETVFKLLQQVSGSRALRIAGLVISAATFLAFLALLALMLGFRTRTVRDAGWWREVVKEWRDSSGLVAMLLRESKRYLEPAFHPRVEESRTLLDAALAELEQLGVERPLRRVVPHGRGLPTAFRDRMSPGLEQARVVLPRNPYFSECIQSYDGA